MSLKRNQHLDKLIGSLKDKMNLLNRVSFTYGSEEQLVLSHIHKMQRDLMDLERYYQDLWENVDLLEQKDEDPAKNV